MNTKFVMDKCKIADNVENKQPGTTGKCMNLVKIINITVPACRKSNRRCCYVPGQPGESCACKPTRCIRHAGHINIVGQALTATNFACQYNKNEKPAIHHDCLQLGDTTLNCSASQLCKIFEYYDSSKLSPPHTLFLLVLLVAVESGFITRSLYEQVCCEFRLLSSTSTFDVENVMHFCGHTPIYDIDVDDTCFYVHLRLLMHKPPRTLTHIYSLLTAIVSGEFMIITLTPDASTKLPGKSTCLCISRFVISKFTPKRLIHHHLRKLDQLAAQLRNDVFVPIRNSQLEYLHRYPYPGLNGLPAELLYQIMLYLDENNLNKLANVNTSLRDEVHRIQGKNQTGSNSYIVEEQDDMGDETVDNSNIDAPSSPEENSIQE